MTKQALGLIIVTALAFNTQGSPVWAEKPIDYYVKLFRSWGINAETADNRLSKNACDQTTKPFFVLATSQTDIGSKAYNNYIVVCDSPENTEALTGTECTPSAYNKNEFTGQESKDMLSVKLADILKPHILEGSKYYFVPQVLLITPYYRERLKEYFAALAKASSDGDTECPTGKIIDLTKNFTTNYSSTFLYKGAEYLLVILVTAVLLKSLLIIGAYHPNKLISKAFYRNILQTPVFTADTHRNLLQMLLVFLLAGYIPILCVLVIRADFVNDRLYPIRYMVDSVNPQRIYEAAGVRNIIFLGLSFYNLAVLLLTLLVLIPKISDAARHSLKQIGSMKLKSTKIKWLFPAPIIITALLLVVSTSSSLVQLTSLTLAITAGFLMYFKRYDIDFTGTLTKSEKRALLAVALTALLFTIGYTVYRKTQPMKITYGPLIGGSERVVLLPYVKTWRIDERFEPNYYSGERNIFADGYLLYSPKASEAITKPLEKYTDGVISLVVAKKQNNVIKALLTNHNLLTYLESQGYTGDFVVNNASNKAAQKSNALEAEIGIRCSLAPAKVDIIISTLTLGKPVPNENNIDKVKNEIVTTSKELLTFPGCSQNSDIEVFKTPVATSLLTNGFNFFRITGIDPKYITDFRLILNQENLKLVHVKTALLDNKTYKVLYSSDSEDQRPQVYSTEVKEEVTVYFIKTKRDYNVSTPVNMLLDKGLLGNPFTLWSDPENEIIRNEL
ncbi:hypothetical protein A2709_02930 [candidate division WWE3 bacterium RIFCSPHIGHO2_01_FULL_43_9]|uniref:Uncharacterized protein n=1 Tax=candidate division WWE3 bacterium RIFCSPHIGHO2_01_FULL_43_9 TaxID=1802618 RepID=A0A1F4V9E5_UNCKA|nr:MAG: hypothetical protein A2709_02930 [candidate division WWE3 bacterium RIFCSPHIGHO2_01_FULL_43_9]